MAIKYQYHDTGEIAGYTFGDDYWIAMTFTPSITHTIYSVKLKLWRSGSPGTITISIRETAGGLPTGSDKATGTIDGDTLDTSPGSWKEITLTPYLLVAGTKYAIVMHTTSTEPTYYAGARGGGTGYGSGEYCYDNEDSGATWNAGTDSIMFEDWGVGSTFPSDAITRVTSLIHRFDRGTYTLEMGLGEVIADFGLPEWESVPRPAVQEDVEVSEIVQQPPMPGRVIPRPTLQPMDITSRTVNLPLNEFPTRITMRAAEELREAFDIFDVLVPPKPTGIKKVISDIGRMWRELHEE